MRSNTFYTNLLVSMILLATPALSNAQFFSNKTNELLPEEQAFMVDAVIDQGTLRVSWLIAEDYYMYREQFDVSSSTAGVVIGETNYPDGVQEEDPEFGQVEVYFGDVEISASITAPKNTDSIDLLLKGQGCNKPIGVCYPPQTRLLSVAFDAATTQASALIIASPTITTSQPSADSARTNLQVNSSKSFWAYVLAAFGAGILLSFTPCVLPMIPILAGVIAGQQQPSRGRSGWLAICYVGGTVVTYAIAGWLAGKSGTQLQAHFQNPWVIGFICALLVLLAASLFGAFKLQLPSSVQTKLSSASASGRSASLSSFALGLISALVVGACVSPVLIVTLGAAITQGDPVLGAAIMSSMALGMGTLLVLFGFGAGWLLPKTGAWMNEIQVVFGFMVLGVAIYIASGLPSVPNLVLWAVLLIIAGLYIWQIAQQTIAPLARAAIRAVGFISIAWGSLALVGGASNGDDILRPLATLSQGGAAAGTKQASLPFQRVDTLAAAQQLLANAKSAGKPVLIDFYADWCLDCRRMHRTTYTKASVAAALQNWQLIEIDVTNTSDNSEQVKRFFDVFGPPATLFINSDGLESNDLRQYGYMDEATFLTFIAKAGELN